MRRCSLRCAATLALLLVAGRAPAADLNQSALPPLPQAVSNNAVAQLNVAGRARLYSFFGLGSARTPAAISRNAYEFDPDTNRWHVLPPVPGNGRLASVAIGVDRIIYLFGGYTVSTNGAEDAVAELLRFDPLQQTYETMAPMPMPVIDSVALLWQQRHVLLVAGRDNHQPLNRVQWFDTVGERWLADTPYPGTPVFGHAGGLLDNELVICGGVFVAGRVAGRPDYALSDACWHGKLNEKVIGEIQWKQLPTMPGPGRYRAAAVGSRLRGKHIVFVGGTDTPYHDSGIDAQGKVAQPLSTVVAYNLLSRRWEEWGTLATAGMDFRGLLELNGSLVTVGGMEAGPKVTPVVRRFVPPNRRR
ncbi:MAG: Kelch repeat-containing protein [Permianibacter sp.]